MEILDFIIAGVISLAPSLTAIFGVISAFCKMRKNNEVTNKEIIDKFETVRQEVMNTKQYEELKGQLSIAHQENRELKKQINELLTKIDKIARED